MRWQAIDLDEGKLRVRQCMESVAALRAHRTVQSERRLQAAAWEDNDLVFCTREGRPIAPTHALRALRTIRTNANQASEDDADLLPTFDIHDLRHTHATHLLADGWPVPAVSRRLGHANAGIIMTIYAHAVSDVRDEEIVTPAALAFTGTY